MDVLKEFDEFESQECTVGAQKTQLELYLDEPRIDTKSKLDIFSFWNANQFQYPDLEGMAGDILLFPYPLWLQSRLSVWV